MKRNYLKITLFLFILLNLSGCATLYNPATERNEFILISSATEKAIGKGAAAEYTKEYPLAQDQYLQARIRRVGERISKVSDRQDIEYQFSVVDNKELNALTLPGGYIYVNSGLMDVLNDDELAFVLAHEAGHVAARHIAKKIQSGMAYQLLLGIAFASAGDKSADMEEVARGIDIVFNIVSLSYSRQDEYQADYLGGKYGYLAGFDPYASISALEKIKKTEGANWKVMAYFRTHPYVDERIEVLKRDIPGIKEKFRQ